MHESYKRSIHFSLKLPPDESACGPNPDESQPVVAFVIEKLETEKSAMNTSNLPKLSLPWTSAQFHECSANEPISMTSQAVTLQCPAAYSGRWLAIRSRTQLQVCLVSVYIENAFDECFETKSTTTEQQYSGTVFRYVRHTPQEACRSACMQASECEATIFTKQRSSGICQLITGFRLHPDREQLTQSGSLENMLDCPAEKCIIEMNYCHGGNLQELENKPVMTNQTDAGVRVSNAQFEQEWLVRKPKRPGSNQQAELVYVLSVFFDGRLECDEWDCGT
ncbi:unnamed protein product [Echinostoma caproni]|uniref:Apple domain-containing protein n=1 Tax=Echinostoma caproni TaxID=27848 RepID=A0A183AN73_9TREM|nr:unnamed protein product [Echinostoma caproni]